MANPPRPPLPASGANRILTRSRRRCPLCVYLEEDWQEQHGQIAHLDRDNSNNSEDNLAFLCLRHHTLYDSSTSQHRNYTIGEVKEYRNRLFDAFASNPNQTVAATPKVPAPASTVASNPGVDKTTLFKICELMTQERADDVFRNHEFGGPFASNILDVVSNVIQQKGPMYEFLDKDLEEKRRIFVQACKAFAEEAFVNTFPVPRSKMRRVPSDWRDTSPRHHERAVKSLNDLASTLSQSYDNLVRLGRRKLNC